MQYNSSKNQSIKRKFVEREVHASVNTMVEYILKKGWEDTDAPFSFDDVENVYQYPCPECGELHTEEADAKDCCLNFPDTCPHCGEGLSGLDDYLEYEFDDPCRDATKFTCPDCEQSLELGADFNTVHELEKLEQSYGDIDSEPSEIYEWWLCSDFLIRKLQEQGECILDSEGIWGRCTSGQAILLDGVISLICEEMEILEGQKYEWKV
jgi:hypothetical protein